MAKLITLPRTAHIIGGYCQDLKIENHMVTGDTGFISWLFEAINSYDWKTALPQMISQGFRFDAVMEQCIEDLKDIKKFEGFIYWFDYRTYDSSKRIKFVASHAGEIIREEIIKKIKTCTGYKKLVKTMKRNNPFFDDIQCKIEEAYNT